MPNSSVPATNLNLGGIPPVTSRFLLEVDGVEIGIFNKVEGLEFEIDMEEIEEGGQNAYVLQVPGRMEWPNIKLSRGLTQSDALFDWISKSSGVGFAGAGNKVVRRTGAITSIAHTGDRLRTWNLLGVLPVKWTGPKFDVGTMGGLEEELEIAHAGFTSKTFPAPA